MTGMLTKAAMLTVDETRQLIESGQFLSIAGNRTLLNQLPTGNWIGGTAAYFMAPEGGLTSDSKLYVDILPAEVIDGVTIRSYQADQLENLIADEPENGFSLIAIPAFSDFHKTFAIQAPNQPGLFNRPLIGWIPGVHLDKLDSELPATFNGQEAKSFDQQAVCMHVQLKPEFGAVIEQINLFNSSRSDKLKFEHDGFKHSHVLVNGEKTAFLEYLKSQNHDIRLPLICDPCGAQVNASIQNLNEEDGLVELYCPVFKGLTYKLADSLVGDYATTFKAAVGSETSDILFSCNCILNHLYSDLEGVKLPMTGPITFGEVGYQLLNQTMVYLKLVRPDN